MNQTDIFMRLTSAGLDNKCAHATAKAIWSDVSRHVKTEIKLAKADEKVQTADEMLAKFLENPLTDEERGKYVRAAMDKELTEGASIQDLERVAKTFGVGKSEDAVIMTVDFKEAFPDLAKAVEWCGKQQPEGSSE
jgi:hypothetical protein